MPPRQMSPARTTTSFGCNAPPPRRERRDAPPGHCVLGYARGLSRPPRGHAKVRACSRAATGTRGSIPKSSTRPAGGRSSSASTKPSARTRRTTARSSSTRGSAPAARSSSPCCTSPRFPSPPCGRPSSPAPRSAGAARHPCWRWATASRARAGARCMRRSTAAGRSPSTPTPAPSARGSRSRFGRANPSLTRRRMPPCSRTTPASRGPPAPAAGTATSGRWPSRPTTAGRCSWPYRTKRPGATCSPTFVSTARPWRSSRPPRPPLRYPPPFARPRQLNHVLLRRTLYLMPFDPVPTMVVAPFAPTTHESGVT
jgi:hypothetical protein